MAERRKDKAPAYQWYPKDAETDEAFKLMTYEQQGIYRGLLDHEWLHGSIPSDPRQIARLFPKISVLRFVKLWPGIADCFVLEPNGQRLMNKKLEEQRMELATYIAERSMSGKQGAKERWLKHGSAMAQPSPPNGTAIEQPMANDSSASASSSATASPLSFPRREAPIETPLPEEIYQRAGKLREELYPSWYSRHRHGAKLRLLASSLEFQEAVRLCETWDDARLEKLATIVLTTDDDWISRTDRGFRIFAMKASWADDRVAQWEKANGVKA